LKEGPDNGKEGGKGMRMIEGLNNRNFNEEWKRGRKGKAEDRKNGGKNL
jgi:hypothetical protein